MAIIGLIAVLDFSKRLERHEFSQLVPNNRVQRSAESLFKFCGGESILKTRDEVAVRLLERPMWNGS